MSADTMLIAHAVSVDFPLQVILEVNGQRMPEPERGMGDFSMASGDRAQASVVATAPIVSDGVVRVGVAGMISQNVGGYSLRVESSDPAQPLSLGQAHSASLPPPGIFGEVPVLFSYRGDAGDIVKINLGSNEFDTYLTIVDEWGNMSENDDANPETTDSQLVYCFEQAGTLYVQASSWRGQGTGRFSVVVSPLDVDVDYVAGRLIEEGEEITGFMRAVGETIDNRTVQSYTIEVVRGREIDVLMRSSALDSYLIAHSPSGRRYEDDDSGGGHDARLVLTADEAGVWTVYPTSFEGDSIGEYTLLYTARAPREVRERFTGQLHDLGRSYDGRVYQVHSLETEAGVEYQIDMRSHSFDTYLVVLDHLGSLVAENDDFGSGTDSRVDFRSEGGTYSILAGAFSGTPAGDYHIEVRW